MKKARIILSMLLAVSMLLSFCGCLRIRRRSDVPGYTSSTSTTTDWETSTTNRTTTAAESTTILQTSIMPGTFTARATIQVPDLSGTDAESAKAILVNCGLVPVIAEEFNNYYAQGFVTRSEPTAFTEVERGTSVTVYVSRGPSYIRASNYLYNWQNTMNSEPVHVQVEQIFVEDNMLYLDFNYRIERYFSDYFSPIDYHIHYFFFNNFYVNIAGNIISATASGDPANGFVRHEGNSSVYRMRVNIPLNDMIPRNPIEIIVNCNVNIKEQYAYGVGTNGERVHTFDYWFSAVNITWQPTYYD